MELNLQMFGGRGASSTRATQTTTQTITQTTNTTTFRKMDDNYAQQLRSDVDDRYDPDVTSALKLYISKKTDSNGYSASQNLNYALDNDLKLDANSKHMDRYLQTGMHDIGIQTELTRGAHDDMLKSLGIKDYTKLSQQELSDKLVGGTFQSKAYMSFSYDDSKNPFLTGSQSGGREIILKVKTQPTTKMLFGAKSQAEIIVNKGTKYKFTKVYYSGGNATPRTGGIKPVLVIEAEAI